MPYYFFSFCACLMGFKPACRPLLFLNRTHLLSKYKGILLGATGKDCNEGLFHVAFAIVDNETDDRQLRLDEEGCGKKDQGLQFSENMKKPKRAMENKKGNMVPNTTPRGSNHLLRRFPNTIVGAISVISLSHIALTNGRSWGILVFSPVERISR